MYEEMVALGYSDESFPVWWYSPGREGIVVEEGETGGKGGTTPEEGGETGGRRTQTKGGEAYAPTSPDTPPPKEGRPALPASPLRSAPGLSEVVPPYPTSSGFSDTELSLLNERRITEITPGRART